MDDQPTVQPIVKTRLEIKPPFFIADILKLVDQRLHVGRNLQLEQTKLAVG